MSDQFYVDNVVVKDANTLFVSGNKVLDCYGDGVNSGTGLAY
jgi:hypothetical protein